ncbi:phosphoprotein [Nasoule virus]|uniref:Phosphoprotein n=1 Tax=Nasoule virus TaxID=864695 RepID=A0AAE8XC20_9RHAB|nr:phosphoprotein [Nasoule virus]UAU42860.1 phosphoprotein [Nasoule virus]
MSSDRLERIQETYNCTKLAEEDEQHFGGGDCEDSGGLYGPIMSGASDGSAFVQSLQMGDGNNKILQGEGISVVPWDPAVVFGEAFVDPGRRTRGQAESDSECESEVHDLNKLHISNSLDWTRGYNQGTNETLHKINELPEIKRIGELVCVNGNIFLKKIEECPSTSTVPDKISEEPKKKRNTRKLAPVFPSQKKESNQQSRGQLLEGEEFLDMIERGLIFDDEQGARYIALDSVDASIYKANQEKMLTLEDWIKLTCT